MTWNEIGNALKDACNEIEIIRGEGTANDVLSRMGINGESTLGQVVSNAKEIYVNRYLRLCGSGNIESVNEFVRMYYPGNKVVVATDLWGGIFVIGNGDFEGHPARLWYYAPESLEWEQMDFNYTMFVEWIASGDVELYYDSWLWYGCEEELEQINSDKSVLMYPFLCSKEFDIATAKRYFVPYYEVIAVNANLEKRANPKNE